MTNIINNLAKNYHLKVIMVRGVVTVNEARVSVLRNGSLLSSVDSDTVYEGNMIRTAKKKEVNIKIITTDTGDMLIRNVPLFDQADIQEMKNQMGEFKYIHIGCISVALEPLIHQKFLDDHGKNIRGICVIFDPTFEDFSQSIISSHKFDLSKRRADFICYPNHCLSVSDGNLSDRVSVLLCMDNIKVRKGNEMMTMCIGHVTTGTNTLNPNKESQSVRSVAVTGTEEVPLSQLDDRIYDALSTASDNCLHVVPSEDDIYIQPKRGKLMSLIKKPPKVILRKSYSTVSENQSKSIFPKLEPRHGRRLDEWVDAPRKSISLPGSPSGLTSSDISGDGPCMSKLYVDGDAVKDAIRNKKIKMISYSNSKIGRSSSSRYSA